MAKSQAYAVGRVRVLERTLIGRAGVERLLSAKTPEEFTRMLSELGWGDAQGQYEVEKLAARHIAEACELVRTDSSEPIITDCFLYRYDIHNLKTLFKAQALGVEAEHLSDNGSVSADKAVHAVREGRFDDFAPLIAEAAKNLERELAIKVDPLGIDSALDKAMFAQINANLAKCHQPEIREYFATQADFTNVLIALRVRDMNREASFARGLMVSGGTVSPDAITADMDNPAQMARLFAAKPCGRAIAEGVALYEQGKGLTELERRQDNCLLGLISPHRFEAASILPVIGYMLAREREAAAVRMILTALLNSFPQDRLRERLRDMYG